MDSQAGLGPPGEAGSPCRSVTVIIVNWNGGELLDRCLACLKRQTLAPARILVADNASEDGSAERAGRVPGVEVLRFGRNLGFAAANNRAIAECDTEFVALLNPDAFPQDGWLAALVDAAGRHPGFGAFGSLQVAEEDPSRLDGIGDAYHVSGAAWRIGYGERASVPAGEAEIFSPCAAAALYRRQALLAAGGFDEDFFCYFEDVDLGFRLRLLGYRSLLAPAAVVAHRGASSSGGRHGDFAVFHGQRNLVWTYFKNMPAPYFWLCLPQHLLLNLAALAAHLAGGRGGVVLRAKWSALRGLPKMLAKRRAIQAARRAPPASVRAAMQAGWLAPYRRWLASE